MTRCILHILLLQLLVLLIPINTALARRDQPIEVTPEQIERLPVIGKLNPTTISNISDFQIIDLNNDGFDEIVCKYEDYIELNALSGQKLRVMSFPFQMHGWSVLKAERSDSCYVFISRKLTVGREWRYLTWRKNSLGA